MGSHTGVTGVLHGRGSVGDGEDMSPSLYRMGEVYEMTSTFQWSINKLKKQLNMFILS